MVVIGPGSGSAALAVVIGFRRHLQFTPALAAASGSLLPRSQARTGASR